MTSTDEENNIVWIPAMLRGGSGMGSKRHGAYALYLAERERGVRVNSWHQVSGEWVECWLGTRGINVFPRAPDTVALVHAPDAHGAHLEGVPNLLR